MNDIISNIVHNNPSEKHFSQYPGEIHIDRILRLRGKNADWIMKEFFPTDLDRIVTRMPADSIQKYRGDIAALYGREAYDMSAVSAELTRKGQKKLLSEMVTLFQAVMQGTDSSAEDESLESLPARYKRWDAVFDL